MAATSPETARVRPVHGRRFPITPGPGGTVPRSAGTGSQGRPIGRFYRHRDPARLRIVNRLVSQGMPLD